MQPLPALTASASLAPELRQELESYVTQMQGYMRTEHARISAWTMVPYTAGDYTANGTMTWTVPFVSVQTLAYTLVGTTMTVAFSINASTIGGVANTTLFIKIPGSMTAAKQVDTTFNWLNNGVAGVGVLRATVGGNVLSLFQNLLAPNWTLSAANNFLTGQISFEVR